MSTLGTNKNPPAAKIKRLTAVRGNIPSELLRWTVATGAREFSLSENTLGSRINEAREHPGEDGCYTTSQMTRVIFGDLYAERFNKLKAETQKIELENAILRGDYLPRVELENIFGQIVEGMRQVVKGSHLNREEQTDLFRQLSSFHVVLADLANKPKRLTDGGKVSKKPKARTKAKAPGQAAKAKDIRD